MKPGFQQDTIAIRMNSDGLNFAFIEPLVYCRPNGVILRNRSGGTSDGPSIPVFVQAAVPVSKGNFFAGGIHDGGYRDTLEMLNPVTNEWIPITLPKEECDDIFLEAQLLSGEDPVLAKAAYLAVKDFGQSSFDADRKSA
jgi:hypothetical protein